MQNSEECSSINNSNTNDNNNVIRTFNIVSKLDKKHKSKVRRQVDLDLGVKPPKTIVFTSKKIYSRKLKHKKDEERE